MKYDINVDDDNDCMIMPMDENIINADYLKYLKNYDDEFIKKIDKICIIKFNNKFYMLYTLYENKYKNLGTIYDSKLLYEFILNQPIKNDNLVKLENLPIYKMDENVVGGLIINGLIYPLIIIAITIIVSLLIINIISVKLYNVPIIDHFIYTNCH